MAKHPQVDRIDKDEACFRLAEVNLLTPDYKALHRYQIVYVVRNDKLAEWRRDLGPAENFIAPLFQIPGGWQHPLTGKFDIAETVGRCWAIADDIRNRTMVDMANMSIPVPNVLGAYARTQN